MLTDKDFEFNILILGVMASVYSTSNNSPKKGWAADMDRTILWEDDKYTASMKRHNGIMGIALVIKKNACNGGQQTLEYWTPFETFDKLKITLPVVQVL